MIRKKINFFLKRHRYILCVMLVTITMFTYLVRMGDLHNSLESKKYKKLLLNEFSGKAKKYIDLNINKRSRTLLPKQLRRWILGQNAKEKILNMDLYGPLSSNTPIFVVLVHNYTCNLNILLASLSEVTGIEDSLIIFSHSYVDHNLNRVIQRIEFCRILQIFYPYSIQANPNEFPGYDKNDCANELNLKAATKLNCMNVVNSDIHGRFREPGNAEKKHHWWWTVNKVFEGLPFISKHKGLFIFLETNYYIYKNFIYKANVMKNMAKSLHQCDFLSLGSIMDIRGKNIYDLEFTAWNPKYHSDILAIDLPAWRGIKSYYKIFCRTDDYSWSRSIFDISINRSSGKVFKVLCSVTATKLQACSSVDDVMDYDRVKDIGRIVNLHKVNKEILFPSYFRVFHEIDLFEDEFDISDYIEVRGGWNDQRDKELCYNMTMNKGKRRNFVTVDLTKSLFLGTEDY